VLKVWEALEFKANFTRRTFDDYPREMARVREILNSVKENGDKAVRAFTAEFDGVVPDQLFVGEEEFAQAERC
jgi:histidinol dehydrogenase